MLYNDFKIIAGASLAIPAWDWAANTAIACFLGQGYSTIDAGYLAFFAPGLVEGPIQWATPQFIDAIVDLFQTREGLNAFLKDPKGTLASLLAQFSLNVTLGSIPGDIWQVIYNRCIELNYHPALTGLLIALGVAAGNIWFTAVSEAINGEFTYHENEFIDEIIANKTFNAMSNDVDSYLKPIKELAIKHKLFSEGTENIEIQNKVWVQIGYRLYEENLGEPSAVSEFIKNVAVGCS